ncbi:MAG: MarR family winged helix-turn-helix transcriptional regulator [Clostridia bacterium]|nr:MarR family winged helix-turn-helix transcriptional regulator [Clostridia bacterium]
MENNILIKGAETISLFCRLNINIKKDLPIRSSEMGLLIFIVKSEFDITPIIASEFFKVSKPMITSMISSLIKNKYIYKVLSDIDKRSYILKPNESAIKLVKNTYDEYFKVMQLLNKELGQEKYNNLICILEESNNILAKGDF